MSRKQMSGGENKTKQGKKTVGLMYLCCLSQPWKKEPTLSVGLIDGYVSVLRASLKCQRAGEGEREREGDGGE